MEESLSMLHDKKIRATHLLSMFSLAVTTYQYCLSLTREFQVILAGVSCNFIMNAVCRFLFDPSCADYKYYEYKLIEEEKALAKSRDSHAAYSGLSQYSSYSSLPNVI